MLLTPTRATCRWPPSWYSCTTLVRDLAPSVTPRVTLTTLQGKTSRIRPRIVSTMAVASVADKTARSISAAVDKALNCRPSWVAMVLNEAANSSNSSRLFTVTRLAKSRWAMSWVPRWSASSGSTLRRIWLTLSSRTARLDNPTTTRKVLVNSTIGSSTSSLDSLNVTLQGWAAKASLSRISDLALR